MLSVSAFKTATEIKVVIGLFNGDVHLWDLFIPDGTSLRNIQSKETKLLYSHEDEVTNLCFNKDGTKVVSCALDKYLYVCDINTGMILFKKEHPNCLICLSLCHENEILYLGDNIGFIYAWNMRTGEQNCSASAFDGPITSITSKLDVENNKCAVIAAGVDGNEVLIKAWLNE